MTANYPNGRHRDIIRIRFSKAGKVRFVSHRDVARLFERALRKLRLPVAYSEGFSPRPKLSFGLALSVSHESDAEYLDVELTELPDLEGLSQALTAALPDGMDVVGVAALEQGSASLQQVITSCTWRIEVLGAPAAGVTAAVAEVLASTELPLERVRKGKTAVTDVRPAILELDVEGPTENGVQLVAHLATETVSLRPTELVKVLGIDGLEEGRVRRTHQWITIDGARHEPVSSPDPSTGHELQRAS
ncbi:MAG: TIGR03936 family radical SAM-associated protein [Actinomycetota bacterium]